jgi:tetratricopeptide (TPR) repeat protein
MNKNAIFLIITLLVVLLIDTAWSQSKKKESKHNEDVKSIEIEEPQKSQRYQSLRSSVQDVDLLLEQGRNIKDTDPKGALNKVEEALGISIAQNNIKNEGKSYVLLGEINESIEEWKLALENYRSAYDLLKPASSGKIISKKYDEASPDLIRAVRGLGTTNLQLGNHDLALSFFREALGLHPNSLDRAEIELDISEAWFQKGNYEEALKTVESITPPKNFNESLESRIQNQKAKIYARSNKADQAVSAYQQSQNTLRAGTSNTLRKDDQSLKVAKEEVVDVLHGQQRYDDEIDLRNKSIEYNLQSNDLPEVTKDKVGLSKALEAKGETSAAIRELEEAAHIADTINDPKEQAKAFLALADLYEKNYRQAEALSAYRKYSEAVSRSEIKTERKLVEKSELINKQKDIEELAKDVQIGLREETIAKATVSRQQLIIYGLLFIIVIIAVTSYFIYKNALASKVANQLLALKSLRSQMNPHFIFNALNSVNQFIAQNDERTANKFLSEFSRLMRLVLENSQEDFIPLIKEQEIISLYLKLEHYRFRDKFDYEITIADDINAEAIEIPPMLVQPYIENAVWHGLRYKESKGHLLLHIGKNDNGLKIVITDNGIGRKRSGELKTENQKKQNSTGLKNIQERLRIINKVYKVDYNIEIADLDSAEGTGTKVMIHLPLRKQNTF